MSNAAENSIADSLKQAVDDGSLNGLHSTIADFQGERLVEVYFNGKDERWGVQLGKVEHGPDTLHDLRSVTKSIVGLLYGIALSQDKVPGLDEQLLAQFPQYSDLKDGGDREKILVRHALTMKMGMKWNEDLPYTDPRNSEVAMEYAKDRYRYALEQPMEIEPGKKWTYSGGAVALIGKLIADGAGASIDQFAKENLFDPLGIKQFKWEAGADGIPSSASGLRLTARGLAKIGAMISNGGLFDGKQIVPKDWLDQSFVSRATVGGGVRYGFLWYIFGNEEKPVIFGAGNGGQRLTVQPSIELVVVSFCGLYNEPNAWQTSVKVMSDHVIPVVRKRLAK